MEPVEKIVMLQGIEMGSNEVPRWWNYFSINSNESNFKSIQFDKSVKLDMQNLKGSI